MLMKSIKSAELIYFPQKCAHIFKEPSEIFQLHENILQMQFKLIFLCF